MDLLEIGWGSVDWIGLAQDRDKCDIDGSVSRQESAWQRSKEASEREEGQEKERLDTWCAN
jgi:hypothetical protein